MKLEESKKHKCQMLRHEPNLTIIILKS